MMVGIKFGSTTATRDQARRWRELLDRTTELATPEIEKFVSQQITTILPPLAWKSTFDVATIKGELTAKAWSAKLASIEKQMEQKQKFPTNILEQIAADQAVAATQALKLLKRKVKTSPNPTIVSIIPELRKSLKNAWENFLNADNKRLQNRLESMLQSQ